MATLTASEEKDWAREHPVPESSVDGNLLRMWNYPVGKSDLSTVHKQALEDFLGEEWVQAADSRVELTVVGHASNTGDPKLNDSLAEARARKVEQYLRGQGFAHITWDSVGSSEPYDTDSSGYALAQNRSVDVTRYTPASPPPPPPPLEPEDPPKPSFQVPDLPAPSSASFEIPISVPLPPIRTEMAIIDSKLEGTLSVKADDKSGGWGGGAVLKDGSLSAKVEKELVNGVVEKLSFDPPSSGKPATLKFGVEEKNWLLSPEIGLQVKPNFLYINFKLDEEKLPDVVIDDVHYSLKFTAKIKCEIGPGPGLLFRAGLEVSASGAAATTAEALVAVAPIAGTVAGVGGAVGVATLMVGGTAYAIQDAKEEGEQFNRHLAEQEGASSQIAYAIIGNDARMFFEDRRTRWQSPQLNLIAEFDLGAKRVVDMLPTAEEARTAKIKAWKERFASDGNMDFTLIRERVFHLALGGYSKTPTVEEALAAL